MATAAKVISEMLALIACEVKLIGQLVTAVRINKFLY